jgi:hypothetical protein
MLAVSCSDRFEEPKLLGAHACSPRKGALLPVAGHAHEA